MDTPRATQPVSKEDLADYSMRKAKAAQVAGEIAARNAERAAANARREEAEVNAAAEALQAKAKRAAEKARADALAAGKSAEEAESAARYAAGEIFTEYRQALEAYVGDASRIPHKNPSGTPSNLSAQHQVSGDYQGNLGGGSPKNPIRIGGITHS